MPVEGKEWTYHPVKRVTFPDKRWIELSDKKPYVIRTFRVEDSSNRGYKPVMKCGDAVYRCTGSGNRLLITIAVTELVEDDRIHERYVRGICPNGKYYQLCASTVTTVTDTKFKDRQAEKYFVEWLNQRVLLKKLEVLVQQSRDPRVLQEYQMTQQKAKIAGKMLQDWLKNGGVSKSWDYAHGFVVDNEFRWI